MAIVRPPPRSLCVSTLLSAFALAAFMLTSFHIASAVPPPNVVCSNGASGTCTINNAYGANYDGNECLASQVFFPRSEADLMASVAYASQYNLTIKVVSQFVHTTPKWYCPGGDTGVVIVTTYYNSIQLDLASMTATVDAGVMLYDFFSYLARFNLTFPTAPYWDGVSVVGAVATGSHGSTLQFKGGRMGQYVTSMTVIVPDSPVNGWASKRVLNGGNFLNAARLHLGLLGAVSKMTVEVYPMWKRQAVMYNTSDANLESEILPFLSSTSFPDLNWYPSARSVFWRKDNLVPVAMPGDGSYTLPLFPGRLQYVWELLAATDRQADMTRNATAQCSSWYSIQVPQLLEQGGGFTNDGASFTGFPVVGFHNRMQSSSGCEFSSNSLLGRQTCAWDPRINGITFFETTHFIPLTRIPDFIRVIKRLRDARPDGFCGIGLYGGVFFRVMKGSNTLLEPEEDGAMVDIQYMRNENYSYPRTNGDISDEFEQIQGKLFNAKPHWGKNRDVAFDNIAEKYPKLPIFLRIRQQLDPRGLFLNDWSRRVFNLSRQPVQQFGDHCALRGICHCKEDNHCNPQEGSFCRSGLVFADAKVCRLDNAE